MKKAFHNKTKTILMIDGVEIPPGEVRHLEEHLHPVQTAAAKINPNQVLVDLLAKSVRDITAELSDLSNGELAQINNMESAAETPRKSLLEALSREAMARAEDPNDVQYQRDRDLAESLEGKTLEQLEALRLEFAEGEGTAPDLAVIDAAIQFVKAGE